MEGIKLAIFPTAPRNGDAATVPRIIGMGMPVVPLILEDLRRRPNHWFWALEAITEQNPVPPEELGKVQQMADAWIEWGIQQGLIAS